MKDPILRMVEFFVVVMVGALAITLLAVLLSQGGDLHCEEDEMAVHGGLEGWYDPDAPLECVSFEEFPEAHTWDEGFDAGFGYGLENGLADRIYDFAYDNGYGDALSDMANSDVTPKPTPKPAPKPEATTPTDTKDGLMALVDAAFPDDPRMGGRVVWNESLRFGEGEWQGYVYGGVMSATGDCGLMQTNWYWHAGKYAAHGWGLADCFDPAKNLVVAREIYDGAGCGAWSTC